MSWRNLILTNHPTRIYTFLCDITTTSLTIKEWIRTRDQVSRGDPQVPPWQRNASSVAFHQTSVSGVPLCPTHPLTGTFCGQHRERTGGDRSRISLTSNIYGRQQQIFGILLVAIVPHFPANLGQSVSISLRKYMILYKRRGGRTYLTGRFLGEYTPWCYVRNPLGTGYCLCRGISIPCPAWPCLSVILVRIFGLMD